MFVVSIHGAYTPCEYVQNMKLHFIIFFKRAIIVSSVIWLLIILLLFAPVFLALSFEPPYDFIEKKARMSGMDEGNIFGILSCLIQLQLIPLLVIN